MGTAHDLLLLNCELAIRARMQDDALLLMDRGGLESTLGEDFGDQINGLVGC